MKFAIIAGLCMLFWVKTTAAEAQGNGGVYGNIGPSKSQVVGAAVGIAAVGAGIGVGVYFLVRHDHRLTGCVASGAGGLQIQREADRQTYDLVGVLAGIEPGARVRVSGRKKAKDAGGNRTFLVEKLSKDLGPCPGISAGH